MDKYHDQCTITSFYCFISIHNPDILLSKITAICMRKSLKGTVLIASEGLNGSLSGNKENINFIIEYLKIIADKAELIYKINYSKSRPFAKLKVKLKNEIITMGLPELDVNSLKGEYIDPKDWDNYLAQDDVVVIDTRNNYEVALGSFKNSINPNTDSFRDFPSWFEEYKNSLKAKKILMFCTGGVRCEKSTAYLRKHGVENVYHLKGGILQYLEETGNKNGRWEGDCFVFDERISVDTKLTPQSQEDSLV